MCCPFSMGITLHDTHGHGPHGHSHGSASHGPAHSGEDSEEERPSTVDEIRDGEEHSLVPKAEKKTNINVRAAFIHVIGDFIQSVGVFTAALLIFFKVEIKVLFLRNNNSS